MKLLITGASGFLGKRTAAYFEKLRHQVLTPAHSQLDITDVENLIHSCGFFRQKAKDIVLACHLHLHVGIRLAVDDDVEGGEAVVEGHVAHGAAGGGADAEGKDVALNALHRVHTEPYSLYQAVPAGALGC